MKVTVEMSTMEREKRARNWARLLQIQRDIKIQRCKVAANTEGYRNTKMQGCCKYRGIQEYNNARLLQIRSTKCNCCKYKDAKELGKVATNMEIVKKSKLFAPNTKMKWRGF